MMEQAHGFLITHMKCMRMWNFDLPKLEATNRAMKYAKVQSTTSQGHAPKAASHHQKLVKDKEIIGPAIE